MSGLQIQTANDRRELRIIGAKLTRKAVGVRREGAHGIDHESEEGLASLWRESLEQLFEHGGINRRGHSSPIAI